MYDWLCTNTYVKISRQVVIFGVILTFHIGQKWVKIFTNRSGQAGGGVNPPRPPQSGQPDRFSPGFFWCLPLADLWILWKGLGWLASWLASWSLHWGGCSQPARCNAASRWWWLDISHPIYSIEHHNLAKLNFDRAGQFVKYVKGNWSILVFLDCRSHIHCFRGRLINKSFCIWCIARFRFLQLKNKSFRCSLQLVECHFETKPRNWRLSLMQNFWKPEKKLAFDDKQSAHCHVCRPTPYLLSSWHPIVLASHLFHSRIVSAPRTLFEPLLTMSLSHWHWPRVWDHPTLRDSRDSACMLAPCLPCSGTECYRLICTVSFVHWHWHSCCQRNQCLPQNSQEFTLKTELFSLQILTVWRESKTWVFIYVLFSQLFQDYRSRSLVNTVPKQTV